LPTIAPAQIEKMAAFEISRQFQGTLDDLQVGWKALSLRADGASDVLLAAAPTEFVARHVDALEACGLRVTRATASVFLWPRLGEAAGEAPSSVLLWECEQTAEYIHLQESVPVFSRGAACLDDPVEFVEETLRLDQKRFDTGSAPLHLRVFSNSLPLAFVCTPECHVELLHELPVKPLQEAIAAADLLCIAGAMDLSSGPASADLLPVEIKKQFALRRTAWQAAKAAMLLAILLALLLACAEAVTLRYEREAEAAREKIAELQKTHSSLATDSSKLLVLKREEDRVNAPLFLLSAIHAATPPSVTIGHFQYDARGSCQIGGDADAYSEILTYMERLKKTGLLKDLKLVYSRSGDGDGASLVDFKLALSLALVPRQPKQELAP
jgi:hypothetical protein